MLATEHCSGLGHHLLDERVTHLRANGSTTTLTHHFGNRPAADEIVQDGRPGVLGEHARRQDGRGGRAREASPLFVDHEHAVGVAIEGQTDVESAGHHSGLQIALIGRLQGIGRVIGERPVELGVHHLEFEARQSLEDCRHHEAAHAVGGVGHHPHRAK